MSDKEYIEGLEKIIEELNNYIEIIYNTGAMFDKDIVIWDSITKEYSELVSKYIIWGNHDKY